MLATPFFIPGCLYRKNPQWNGVVASHLELYELARPGQKGSDQKVLIKNQLMLIISVDHTVMGYAKVDFLLIPDNRLLYRYFYRGSDESMLTLVQQ